MRPSVKAFPTLRFARTCPQGILVRCVNVIGTTQQLHTVEPQLVSRKNGNGPHIGSHTTLQNEHPQPENSERCAFETRTSGSDDILQFGCFGFIDFE